MAHYTHQCHSPTEHTATPEAVASIFNRPAIDLTRPAKDDSMDDQNPNSSVSDCKIIVSAGQYGTPPSLFIGGGLMELGEGDKDYRLVKERFISRLAALGVQVTLMAIRKNCFSSVSAKGRAQAFQVYSRAVQIKGGDNAANVKYAWYATSKGEVIKILSYGFGCSGKPENHGLYGCGVYFGPYDRPLERVLDNSREVTKINFPLDTIFDILELSRILPPSHVSLISKYHGDFNETKIPRLELIQKFRQIAGIADRLLNGIFEKFRTNK